MISLEVVRYFVKLSLLDTDGRCIPPGINYMTEWESVIGKAVTVNIRFFTLGEK